MSVARSDRDIRNRVIALLRDALGYGHLGDWTDRARNCNIEEGLLSVWLTHPGDSEAQISMVLDRLREVIQRRVASLRANRI
jgi:type I restriction enzyme, R subunit